MCFPIATILKQLNIMKKLLFGILCVVTTIIGSKARQNNQSAKNSLILGTFFDRAALCLDASVVGRGSRGGGRGMGCALIWRNVCDLALSCHGGGGIVCRFFIYGVTHRHVVRTRIPVRNSWLSLSCGPDSLWLSLRARIISVCVIVLSCLVSRA